MSVNFNAQNLIPNGWAGVDVQNVSKVSEQIFQRAQQKTVDLNKVDLTKFNRQSQGIDLYNQNVALETQRFIAMQNAGLVAQVNNSTLAQLNAQAALNLYGTDVSKKVQGRISVAIPEGESEKKPEVFPVFSPVEVFSAAGTAKDKRGSDSLPYQKSSLENEDEKDNLDIQA